MKVRPSIKILQSQGLGSRKICEEIFWTSAIFRDNTRFNPEVDEILMGDHLKIDGIDFYISPFKYVLLHKPCGYETSHKPSRHPSVFSLLPTHYVCRGLQAAGRLDLDTTGLLLFSDDGQFIHKLISGKLGVRKAIEKVYYITGAGPFSDQQIQRLLGGVLLDDEPDVICASQAVRQGEHELLLGITTGKYHQVKRMIAAVGNHVVALHRLQVGPYELPHDLAEGAYVEVDPSVLLTM